MESVAFELASRLCEAACLAALLVPAAPAKCSPGSICLGASAYFDIICLRKSIFAPRKDADGTQRAPAFCFVERGWFLPLSLPFVQNFCIQKIGQRHKSHNSNIFNSNGYFYPGCIEKLTFVLENLKKIILLDYGAHFFLQILIPFANFFHIGTAIWKHRGF
jgi:hypothetical protein